MSATEARKGRPASELPRENLVRAVYPADIEVRSASGDAMPTLEGHFAVFNTWTEINSIFEGNFMESIAPGAFDKTIAEGVNQMRVLFNHGGDPHIGDKVLGSIKSLEADDIGPRYEVPLFDTSYNRDLVPGLRAGVYGASFRFRVLREELVDEPGVSDYNPRGLTERTITELQCMEFGPVTFPAYPEATAGVRSLTDQYRLMPIRDRADREQILLGAPRMDTEDIGTLAKMMSLGAAYIEEQDEPDEAQNIPVMEGVLSALGGLVPFELQENEPGEDEEVSAPPEGELRDAPADESPHTSETTAKAAPTHPPSARRVTQRVGRADDNERGEDMDTIEEMVARQGEIRREMDDISNEFRGTVLDQGARARYDALKGEWQDLAATIHEENERAADRIMMAQDQNHLEGSESVPWARASGAATGTGSYVTRRAGRDQTPDDVFEVSAYHSLARDQDHLGRIYTIGARQAIETLRYPHERAETSTVNAHIEKLLQADNAEREIAQRILRCGSPAYKRAFFKHITGQQLNAEEQRAMAVGALGTGGAAVPVALDPTLIPTSNQALNPLRAISRVFTTTSYIWYGVTSGGVTAQYRAEGAGMTDNSPTLVQPSIQPERVDSFVPFSYELGQDWGALESSLASEIQDAKDVVEATKFAVGAGHSSNEPQGVLAGSGTLVGTAAATAFSVTDIYGLENALPARYIPNAKWVATTGLFQKVRQLDIYGGSSLWVQLQDGNPPSLIGYPAYRATNIGTAGPALTSTAKWGIFGDFSRYAIVDRIGMEVRVIPDLFGGTAAVHYPTGQSGLVAFWRNSAGVLDSNAFRVGTIQ